MIVEFAIENAQVVNRRSEREKKARREPGEEVGGRRDRRGPPRRELFKTVEVKGDEQGKPLINGKDGKEDEGAESADKQASRQRIIGRKRMARKAKRAG